MRKITDFPKNKIAIEDLQDFMRVQNYAGLVELVSDLTGKGLISPIKSSGLNGKKPALYQRYRIDRPSKDYSAYQEELMYQLVPILKNDYYMGNLEAYLKDRLFVLLLNDFIKEHKECLKEAVSYNERSFEIWGREKFLNREGGIRILKNLGLKPEDINVYDTTEPLAYYSHHKRVPQKILILENKDTFYSMRKHLLGNNSRILGEEIGTLIYGAGKSIHKSFRDFTFCVEPYLNDEKNEILYFGDLDYEGILIYETLQENFRDKVKLKPFCTAYEAMLNKADRIKLPDMKEGQNRNIGIEFFSYFSNKVQEQMKHLLEQNSYIPQEILQRKDF
ncbi:MAG: hypothetical protein E7255_01200 [Lachnospiraceae bacterium]|jgi:hypothetical protein|nr:hypothetical protein [Lachnospiraceae bacterium]